MKRLLMAMLALSFIVWPTASLVKGQGATIKDVVIQARVFNDNPASLFSSLKAKSVVAFADTKMSADSGFANRHVWRLAEDAENIHVFGINDFFDLSFDLSLLGTPISPRKEAGIIISTDIAGEGQFIVNTDGHEVVAFGGPFPFYSFGTKGMTYNSGDKVNLRLRYFRDTDGKRKIEYFANGVSSGALEITNNEQGIPGQFIIGGYLQTVITKGNLDNHGVAVFDNILWNGKSLAQ